MQIPLFRSHIHKEAYTEVSKVLQSGWLGQGKKVEEFEKAFAEYVGNEYAVATNSGTEALRLALAALNLPAGSKVLTTPNTFVSTNHVILQSNLQPVFCDIDPKTGNISEESVARMLARQYPPGSIKAIMVVHFSGLPVDLDYIYALAHKYNLEVIEDCAHAAGASYAGSKIGHQTRLACFSFAPAQNLTTGDGGMVVTNYPDLYNALKMYSWLGIDKSTASRTSDKTYSWNYNVIYPGFKANMNDIAAAIGLVQLKFLDEDNAFRAKVRSWYESYLPPQIGELAPILPGRTSSNHFVVLHSKYKSDLMPFLQQKGVQVGYHYKSNLHYPMYKSCPHDTQVGMEQWQATAITLPTHLYLMKLDVLYIAECMEEFLKSRGYHHEE